MSKTAIIVAAVAITAIHFDGKSYAPGAALELPPDEFERLLAAGAGRRHDGAPPGAPKPKTTVAGAIELLVSMVESGDRAADYAYTSDGKPDTRVLAGLTGTAVSAAERDAAWDAYREARAEAEAGEE